MIFPDTLQLTQQEARSAVNGCLQATDLGGAVIELLDGGINSASLDTLKIAEFALWTPTITGVVEGFVDETDEQLANRTLELDLSRNLGLSEYVGTTILDRVSEEIARDPNISLLRDINEARAERYPISRRHSITPVNHKLRLAATSAGVQIRNHAILSGLVATEARQGDFESRDEFLDIVKRSTQLVLAHPRVHLQWNGAAAQEVYNLAWSMAFDGERHNPNALAYDPSKRLVVVREKLPSWVKRPQSGAEDDGLVPELVGAPNPIDVRIGCPITFNPKLLSRHYRQMVDMLEYLGDWWPEDKFSSIA